MLEKIVFKYLFNYLSMNGIISKNQSGFLPKDSTVNQLISIYDTIMKQLDRRKEARLVFCDISKAFDRVWHDGLIYKLKKYGINDNILKWLSNYLIDRQQRVIIDEYKSMWKAVTAGVPQGSVLGPYLFLIYINDLENEIYSNVKFFADDTSLFVLIDNDQVAAAGILTNDLNKIPIWANKLGILFNPNKTEALLISNKHNADILPPDLIFMNNTVTNVNKYKHLGVILNSHGTWSNHINFIFENT